MLLAPYHYNLNDVNEIATKGFEYTIPDDVIDKITRLNQQLPNSVPIVVKKWFKFDLLLSQSVLPIQQKPSDHHYIAPKPQQKNRNNRNKECDSESWEKLTARPADSFAPTKIERKSGIDGQIEILRAHINKLSPKNAEVISANIHETVQQIVDSGATPEEIGKVGDVIFNLASNNSKLAMIYATMYTELITAFPALKIAFTDNFSTYSELFKQITYVDPDENYDEFCNVTKINQRRRSISEFFICLAKTGIIKRKSLTAIIKVLLETVLNYIDYNPDSDDFDSSKQEVMNNPHNVLDEIAENLAILCHIEIIKKDKSGWILDTLKEISQMDVSQHVNLTKRSIFKYMDILDAMEKSE